MSTWERLDVDTNCLCMQEPLWHSPKKSIHLPHPPAAVSEGIFFKEKAYKFGLAVKMSIFLQNNI